MRGIKPAVCAALIGGLIGAPRASAQSPPPAFAPIAPSPASVSSARADEAGLRFKRGVDLYAEGDLSAALVEFTRAYELVPRYKILYNIAQITYQQQDYVSTVRHFRRYLADGGDDIPPPRRREVQQEIVRLEQRVGKLDIQAPLPDARVIVDGIDVGSTPLPGLVDANVGRRHIELQAAGGQRWSRFVDLAGGDVMTVVFATTSPQLPSPGRRPVEDAPLPLINMNGDALPSSPASAAPSWPWLAWTTTAVLAAGAGVAGGFAWQSSRDLDTARRSYPTTPEELQHLHDRTRTLSFLADGATVTAVIMAGVSTYLTWRWSGARGRDTLSLRH